MVFKHHAPGWVYAGGFALTVAAGWLNVIGYLGLAHQSLSHVTGTVTISAMELSRGGVAPFARALAVVGCFFAGATLTGLIIRDSSLHVGQRYGVALLVESALLAASLALFLRDAHAGEYLAAAACGLQNALATSYSGAVLRTTHMTGIVTDLGLAVGHALHGTKVDWLRVRLHLVLFVGFLVGGVGGALAFGAWSYGAMLVPIAITGLSGAAYTTWLFARRHTQHAPPAPPP